jgi:hypothetical protein
MIRIVPSQASPAWVQMFSNWDCVRLNGGSWALVRKLGFVNERAYRLLAWFKLREPHFGEMKR